MSDVPKINCFVYSRTRRKDYRLITQEDVFVDPANLSQLLESESTQLARKKTLVNFEKFGKIVVLMFLFQTNQQDERGRKIDAVIGFDLTDISAEIVITEFVSEMLEDVDHILDMTNFFLSKVEREDFNLLQYDYIENCFNTNNGKLEKPVKKVSRMEKAKARLFSEKKGLRSSDLKSVSEHFNNLMELPSLYRNFSLQGTTINKSKANVFLRKKYKGQLLNWPAGVFAIGFSGLLGEDWRSDG